MGTPYEGFTELENAIPQDIRDFLSDCIESVSQLELLFIILGNKQKKWTAPTISRELRTNPAMANKQMDLLHAKGILFKENEFYSYAPKSQKLDELITKLSALYNERPVAIVTYIFTKPEDKLKGFADAFKFKKD